MGVLHSFLPGGGEFAHQKNCPGGWSGLELTDTLQKSSFSDVEIHSLDYNSVNMVYILRTQMSIEMLFVVQNNFFGTQDFHKLKLDC